MAFDVFVSYAHHDKPTADAACATLEAQGVRCWIAPRDIVPGSDWGASIIDAIAAAKVMVLIFSGHANESPQIKREVERAVNRGIPIVPVRIEDVVPSRSLEYFISTPHWLDAFTPPMEDHLRKLASAVYALLKIEEPPVPPRERERRLSQTEADHGAPRGRLPPPLWIAAGIAALVVVLGLAWLWMSPVGDAGHARILARHPAEVDASAFSPDGKELATGGYDGAIKIWAFDSGALIRTIVGHYGKSVAFSPDGAWIASGTDVNKVGIWDAVSGQPFRQPLVGHTGKVMAVAFTPDGKQIVSAGADAVIKVWDVASGTLLRTLTGHSDVIAAIAISPDGKRILSGSHDGTVKIWSAATGEQQLSLASGPVETAALSPDGKWILAGAHDGSVKGWDESGLPLNRAIKHEASLMSVAFSPDGRWIVSADYAGVVKISDAKSGQTARTWTDNSGAVFTANFSPDGKWVAAAGADGQIREWPAPQ